MSTNEKAVKLVSDDSSDTNWSKQLRQATAIKLARQKPESHAYFQGEPYYILGNNDNGSVVMVDSKTNSVIYAVNYRRLSIFGNAKLGRQVALWRNRRNTATIGFPQFVFFEILLPQFNTLISDREQTEQGMGFWQHAVKRAFSEHLKVYMLLPKPHSLFLLSNIEDVKKHEEKIWGYTSDHLNSGLIISRISLKQNVSPNQRIQTLEDLD